LKHVEFVWFHYDFLPRSGEDRHLNSTAALYERPFSDNGPLGRQELPPSSSPSLAENQVKACTHSKCLQQDHVLPPPQLSNGGKISGCRGDLSSSGQGVVVFSVQNDNFRKMTSVKKESNNVFRSIYSPGIEEFGTGA
jgi:hypothetical protein